MLQDGIDNKIPSVDELMAAIPEFDQDTDIATRIAGQMVLQVCVFGSVLLSCGGWLTTTRTSLRVSSGWIDRIVWQPG